MVVALQARVATFSAVVSTFVSGTPNYISKETSWGPKQVL